MTTSLLSLVWVSLWLNISTFHAVIFESWFHHQCLTPQGLPYFITRLSRTNSQVSSFSNPGGLIDSVGCGNSATVWWEGALQSGRRDGQRRPSHRGEKYNPHLIKLLINTPVLRGRCRKGGITVYNLCPVSLNQKPKTKTVKPSPSSCFEQVSVFFLFPFLCLCAICCTG